MIGAILLKLLMIAAPAENSLWPPALKTLFRFPHEKGDLANAAKIIK